MKRTFSTKWISSRQKRKQRKYRFNAPLHTKHKFLNASLSKSLREKYGKRSLTLRKGDEVLVISGQFRKTKAKVSLIDLKNTRVALEKIQRSKKDGTKISVHFRPSVLMITSPTLEDKERIKKLNKK